MKRLKDNIRLENDILLKKLKSLPDKDSDKAVRYKELLLKNNDGLIHQIINGMKKYLCVGFEYQDAEQVCRMELLRCAERYDPQKSGSSFGNYTAICMRARILEEYRANVNKIHVPADKAKDYKDRLTYVDVEDIAYLEDEDEILIEDIINENRRDIDRDIIYAEMREKIINAFNDIISPLTARETMCVILRYGLDGGKELTFAEIGKRLNVTQERVRQITAKAERKLASSMCRQNLKEYIGLGEVEEKEPLAQAEMGKQYVDIYTDKRLSELKKYNDEYEREDIKWER